ncbi:hypothetical protein Syun_031701 [Stephania yunnanensis]|uniref:Uncharacterized protein n=1 Tax=Stephania yunnanensis TaxID=152371 RepID=A0AAP0DZD1_9MAGN
MVDSFISKPDVVEGTDDEVLYLPCWDLTETSKRDDGIDLLKDKQALQRLTETVEKAKMDLSSLTQTNISLPFITATADGPKHIKTTITRAKFEELCSNLLDRRLKTPVENSLRDDVHGWAEPDPHRNKLPDAMAVAYNTAKVMQDAFLLVTAVKKVLIRNGIRDGIHKFINSVSDSVANQQRNQRRNAITNVPFRKKFHFCSVSVPFLISVSNQKRNFSVSIPSLIRNGINFSVSDRISDDVFRDGIDSVSRSLRLQLETEFLQIRDEKFRF